MFFLILKQSLFLSFRKGGGAAGTLAFYVMTVTLFTFALGPEAMARYAGAAMAVGLLLAIVTSLPLLYERDFEDGTLEQYLLQPVLLETVALAKIGGHWLAVTLPMLAVSPLLALMSGIAAPDMLTLMLRLALAAPTILALGSIAAALTLGARRGGLLQALVIIPLSMPVLIFAAAGEGQGAWLFLLALLLAALPLSCLACAALLKASQD